jgi:beta-glucosidase
MKGVAVTEQLDHRARRAADGEGDAGATGESWIEASLARLGLDEKVSLLAGLDGWRTVPVPRVDIPSIKMSDGPNGARGNAEGRVTAACFPVGTALAASWNVDLLAEVGQALAAEAKTKGAQVLLGPTVNLHRSPLAGRNFECYSEDPYLSARLAVAYITGLQSQGVGACVKHLVANDSEFERMTISSEVAERPLRELYLVPFEAAVTEAGPWMVMAAYNRINGTYACENDGLLIDLLKHEWGFDGAVVSDWGAVHATVAAALGGCDLEMPGPARHFGDQLVVAVRDGSVGESLIDDKVRRVLRTIWRAGRLDRPDDIDETAVDLPEHRRLARRAATEGMVLLKNEPVAVERSAPLPSSPMLPLRTGPALRTLAVIGPNARVGVCQGGGSSVVRPHYIVHPLEAIIERAGEDMAVVYSPGCPIDRYRPEPDPGWFVPLDADGRGLRIDYFDSEDLSGAVVATRLVRSVSWAWWQPPPEVTDGTRFSSRWTGTFVAPTAGAWSVGVASLGRARVFVDGEERIDNWSEPVPGEIFFGAGSSEVTAAVDLEAGRRYDLRVEYSRGPERGPAAIHFGMTPPPADDPIDAAAAVARDADAVVLVVGTNSDWETEGSDRPSMRLPGRQDELIARVTAANARTAVVLNVGGPVEMPWAEAVPAIVQVWFPGQEFGHALADVVFGDAEPGGRLPTTFPVRYEDHPALFNYPGEDGRVVYGEGLFVGYRGYDRRRCEPRFAFGHGLSYTSFSYGPVSVDDEDAATVYARVEVTNIGERTGHEVVQLYVRPPGGRLVRPDQELKGWAKVMLAPGESRTVTLPLGARSFAAYDPAMRGWVAEAGPYEVAVGSSSRDIRSTMVLNRCETAVIRTTPSPGGFGPGRRSC